MTRRRSTGVGPVLLAVVSVALVVMLLVWRQHQLGQVPVEDGCLPAGPSGLMVVAVDATDTLSVVQRLDVTNRIQAAVQDLPPNWRLEVWTVAPTTGLPEPVGPGFCKPEQNVSGLTANPRRARERYAEFEERFSAQVNAVLDRASSDASPILEALQAVGLRTYRAPAASGISQRRLLLVSDLIQHTPRVSFLRSDPEYDVFRNGPDYRSLLPPLEGVEVEVLLLSRATGPSPAALVEWWQELFFDVGARLTAVSRIVG